MLRIRHRYTIDIILIRLQHQPECGSSMILKTCSQERINASSALESGGSRILSGRRHRKRLSGSLRQGGHHFRKTVPDAARKRVQVHVAAERSTCRREWYPNSSWARTWL